MLGDSSQAECAWICPPQENRLFAFDGRLLHGVVPYHSSLLPGEDITKPRITLMMGWWPRGVNKSFGLRKGFLGPNMTLPKSSFRISRGSETRPHWLNLIRGDGQKYSQVPVPSSCIIEIGSPIWDTVTRENVGHWSSFASRVHLEVKNSVKERRNFERIKQLALENNISFVGNWFLKSLEEIGSEIMGLSAASHPGSSNKREKSFDTRITDESEIRRVAESSPIEWISLEELSSLRRK